ncbi:MAG: threonine/serine exporter [Clostridiaceae bacterium]|jgi:uncharacterized membrane protein YjjB (DUF3815 family)|nr:threonine/serine exporter [Clostridiaceae bacterium]
MKHIIIAFIGSLCPAVLINVDRRNLIWAGFSGLLGRLLYDHLVAIYPGSALVSVFLGTAVVAVYSEVMARVRKTPATIFSIPGIFPLVPGVDAYHTIQSITEQDYVEAAVFGINVVAKASLIALGVLVVSAVFRKIMLNKKQR